MVASIVCVVKCLMSLNFGDENSKIQLTQALNRFVAFNASMLKSNKVSII